MSSSVHYAMRLNKRESSNAVSTDSDKNSLSGISIGILFSIVYIGVASNFYVHLTRLDSAVGGNCSSMYSTDLEPNLTHFCENAIAWKVCALLGIVVSGVLYFVLGCVTLCIVDCTKPTRCLTCQHLWGTYDFLTKLVALAIFVILLTSDAHHFVIATNTYFKTAALVYVIVVGIETGLWLLTLTILLTCGVCSCCILCCCAKH